MISLQKFKVSGLIDCFEKYGYDRVTAHSFAFLLTVSGGEKDLSDFYPTIDGVMYKAYTAYGIQTCEKIMPINANTGIITSVAKKVWKFIVKEKVTFNDEELELIKSLNLDKVINFLR